MTRAQACSDAIHDALFPQSSHYTRHAEGRRIIAELITAYFPEVGPRDVPASTDDNTRCERLTRNLLEPIHDLFIRLRDKHYSVAAEQVQIAMESDGGAVERLFRYLKQNSEVWLPIDTAPKDGTEFMAWVPSWYGGKGGPCMAIWFNDRWMPSDKHMRRIEPSHWKNRPVGPCGPATAPGVALPAGSLQS